MVGPVFISGRTNQASFKNKTFILILKTLSKIIKSFDQKWYNNVSRIVDLFSTRQLSVHAKSFSFFLFFFSFSKFQRIFHKLLNQYQTRLYLFECIPYGDSK